MEKTRQEAPHQKNGYWRCLTKAMSRTHQLLREKDPEPDYEKIHSVKSVLYAAIEQAGMESERLVSVQGLLRELLALVALRPDPLLSDRREALHILEELKTYHPPPEQDRRDVYG